MDCRSIGRSMASKYPGAMSSVTGSRKRPALSRALSASIHDVARRLRHVGQRNSAFRCCEVPLSICSYSSTPMPSHPMCTHILQAWQFTMRLSFSSSSARRLYRPEHTGQYSFRRARPRHSGQSRSRRSPTAPPVSSDTDPQASQDPQRSAADRRKPFSTADRTDRSRKRSRESSRCAGSSCGAQERGASESARRAGREGPDGRTATSLHPMYSTSASESATQSHGRRRAASFRRSTRTGHQRSPCATKAKSAVICAGVALRSAHISPASLRRR